MSNLPDRVMDVYGALPLTVRDIEGFHPQQQCMIARQLVACHLAVPRQDDGVVHFGTVLEALPEGGFVNALPVLFGNQQLVIGIL